MSLRTGFSTSACAAAAACAGILTLSQGRIVDKVQIMLLNQGPFEFRVKPVVYDQNSACYAVIKDAGDDPDVTNGIEIQVKTEWNDLTKCQILGGTGVGTITQPGLLRPVGDPAINPGSERLIEKSVTEFCHNNGISRFFDLTIMIPEGERIAQQTMNPKLGIIGGISILGTDGRVRPYSLPAFRMSIAREMGFAQANGYTEIGLSTGKRSAAYLSENHPFAYIIDAGDELDYPLRQLNRYPFRKLILGGMIGKMTKTAQNRFQTHVDQGGIDFGFISRLAAAQGASPELIQNIQNARTAHQIQVWLKETKITLEPTLAALTLKWLINRIPASMRAEVCVYSLEGKLLGHAESEYKNG